MRCPDCGHEYTALANFCSHCGRRVRLACLLCGEALAPGDRYCGSCGAGVDARGTPPLPAAPPGTLRDWLPASAAASLGRATEGENRLVTVLFADMSSSVKALHGLAAETAAEQIGRLLAAMVEEVIRHQGSVDRFLGDGLLAIFGVPRARESDPQRAILAAMAIREAAGKLGIEVTAGINTGEVYLGGLGSEQHRELTVMGPVVSLASRFQARAAPGQILVGEATYAFTRRSFEFSPITFAIRGIDAPVTAFAALRVLPRFEKVRGIEGLRAELIGRDAELAQLKELFAQVAGGQGQMVSLCGEAGLGKTRLVAELEALAKSAEDAFVAHARPAPFLWLEGRCLEMAEGSSYSLFLDLLGQFFAWRSDENESQRQGRIAAVLRDLVAGGSLSAERAGEIGALLSRLFSLRPGSGEPDPLDNVGPEPLKHMTFRAVGDFLRALSGRQPVLLICEDLHWADTLSLELIAFLMGLLDSAPLLLLCTYRPEPEHGCVGLEAEAAERCPERYTRLPLRELTTAQSRQLVRSLLVIEDLTPAARALILEKSRGNPFFLEEILRSLIDSGMIHRETPADSFPLTGAEAGTAAGIWRARPELDPVAVPESIQSVIQSRVDRLPAPLQKVLQSAAVIGRLFRRPVLEAVLQRLGERDDAPPGTPPGGDRAAVHSPPSPPEEVQERLLPSDLDRALAVLEERWLIHRERVLPDEEYSFQHVLIQETIYAGLLRRHRALLHRWTGEAIEARYMANLPEQYEPLAYHYRLGGGREKAVEYLLKAGEKTRQSYLNTAAAEYFQQALEALDPAAKGGDSPAGAADAPSRLTALTGLGQVHLGTGNMAAAEECFRQAIAAARESGASLRELVRLYYRLGDVLYWQSRWDELIRIGEEGLALLGEEQSSLEAAMMNHIAAVGYSRRDRTRQLELVHRTEQFLLDLPYCEELRPVFDTVALCSLFYDRDAQKSLAWLDALEARATAHGDLRAMVNVHATRGELLLAQGDLPGAIRAEQQGRELAQRIGDLKAEASCASTAGRALLASGAVSLAESTSRAALEIMVGDESDIAETQMVIGTASLCRGAWEPAREAFERARDLLQGQSAAEAAIPTAALGRLELARGEREEARAQFEAALTMAQAGSNGTAVALAGLEEALADDPPRFRALSREWQQRAANGAPPRERWFLHAAACRLLSPSRVQIDRFEALSPDWSWHDPFGDCSFSLQTGVVIDAANGRDLRGHNQSAPRLLRRIGGEFAFEAVCAAASGDRPALGGLLLWRDAAHFLRLDTGSRGRREITFLACQGSEGVLVGRGRLDVARLVLRLERWDGLVRSLCSSDGQSWFTLGEVEFHEPGPLEVGLYGIGSIDRALYPGAHPEGASIRFESCRWWA